MLCSKSMNCDFLLERIIHEEPDVFREAEFVATLYYPLQQREPPR